MSVVLSRARRTVTVAAMSLFFLLALGGTSAWALSDFDGDGSVPPADCNNLDPAVHPGAVDKPDLNFEDTNCDGIDGDLTKAVFVWINGNDSGSGTKENPLQTFTAAVGKVGKVSSTRRGAVSAEPLPLPRTCGCFRSSRLPRRT